MVILSVLLSSSKLPFLYCFRFTLSILKNTFNMPLDDLSFPFQVLVIGGGDGGVLGEVSHYSSLVKLI